MRMTCTLICIQGVKKNMLLLFQLWSHHMAWQSRVIKLLYINTNMNNNNNTTILLLIIIFLFSLLLFVIDLKCYEIADLNGSFPYSSSYDKLHL